MLNKNKKKKACSGTGLLIAFAIMGMVMAACGSSDDTPVTNSDANNFRTVYRTSRSPFSQNYHTIGFRCIRSFAGGD